MRPTQTQFSPNKQAFLPKIACLGLFLMSACGQDATRGHQLFTTDDTGLELVKGVEILYSDSALVRVRITAPLLRNFSERDNPRQEFPEGLKVEFLDSYQQIRSTLIAKTATRFTEKGLVIARDSVVLTTAQQEKLETEELTWDEKTEKISTEKFVKITKPDEVIYGFGLTANQDFSYWKLNIPKGRIKVKKLD